jgi:hypothetical protein
MSFRTNPAASAEAITPHDSNTIERTRGVFVGTGGSLSVRMADGGAELVFKNIASGTIVPIEVDMVLTDSTAEDLIALR